MGFEERPRRAPAVLLAGLLLAATANAQTAEEIVGLNVAARGGLQRWRTVQTLRYVGRMDVGRGMQVPFRLELKRPRKMRLEFEFQGKTVVQAYDGRAGYKLTPYMGSEQPEALSPEELKVAASQAELDGPLLDYAAKGHRLELLGREPVEGKDAFRLAVTLDGGAVRQLLLDAASGLEVKLEGTRLLRGKEHRVDTFFREYRSVDGLVLPFVIETRLEGAPSSQKLIVQRVDVNPPLDEGRFAMMPAAGRAAEPAATASATGR